MSHRANHDPKNGLRSSEQAYLFVYQSSIFRLQIETNFEGSFWSNPSDEDFFLSPDAKDEKMSGCIISKHENRNRNKE